MQTIEEIKADIERLNKEIEQADIERGYCVLPFEPVSDVWAYESYKRHWSDIKPFLTEYARLLIQAKTIIKLDDTEKLREWQDVFNVASHCNDIGLMAQCTIIANIFLPPIIQGHSEVGYAQLAEMIAQTVTDYPLSVYDLEQGDYDGNYDEYYQQKQEAYKRWEKLIKQ